ncbi:MAG TPA: glycosyltransferase family 2 protein [Candidatus Moranbacteria bacterium]|nr:glycosyltransferase family 2 protein [Candidatus Moranbacteria bacterium]
MELSIIITSYKNPELLKVCIDSIKNNLALDGFEIIVADSATEEKTEMMMREDYPEIKFIPSKKNIGFGALVRNGYEISNGRYVLIINGDVIIKKNSIEKLLEYIKNNLNIGIVGPKLLGFDEKLQFSCFRYYTPFTVIYRRTFLGKLKIGQKHIDNFLMKEFDHKSIREVDWIQGSAMLTSREAISKVGLIDQKFKMYFEDVDWCRRFWENNYKVIYFPDSEMYHYHGRGSAGRSVIKSLISNYLTWWHIKSALVYFWKYWGKPLPKHN